MRCLSSRRLVCGWYTARMVLTYFPTGCSFRVKIGALEDDVRDGRIACICFFVLVLILICAGSSSAQLFPGRVTGVVRDTQGAAIPDASVKLSNPATGLERTKTTDANGEFNFPDLALGSYRLTVSKSGFQTVAITDIVTSQNEVNTVSPTLKVGNVTSEIEVTSAPPLLQTETASVGGQLTQEQVTTLRCGKSCKRFGLWPI